VGSGVAGYVSTGNESKILRTTGGMGNSVDVESWSGIIAGVGDPRAKNIWNKVERRRITLCDAG